VTGRRGPGKRLSTGHWIMLLAGMVAVVLNFAFLRSQQHTVDVAVAAVDLSAGSLLDTSDVTFTPVHADESVARTLLTRDDFESGMTLARAISAGSLLSESDLTSRTDGRRTMSIPIDRDHAVGGLLGVGDRVDVVAAEAGSAQYVLVGAEVVAVSEASGSLGSDYSVTLALDAEEVLRIAAAMSAGSVELVRSTGASPPEAMTYPSEP